jgi:hypothetical protein
MGDEEETVLARGEPEQGGAEERPAEEIERALGLRLREGAGGALAALPGEAGEVDERQREGAGRGDPLRRLAVDRREGGAQRLVPGDDLRQAPGEEVGGEGAVER